MKANELRLGNLVWNDVQNIPCPVDFKILNDVHHNINDWTPILLTEEWLIRLGFEKVYKSTMHSTYWIKNLSYYFWNDKGNQYADCKGLQVNCEYLHQLQNLYFALTGEELTLNK